MECQHLDAPRLGQVTLFYNTWTSTGKKPSLSGAVCCKIALDLLVPVYLPTPPAFTLFLALEFLYL